MAEPRPEPRRADEPRQPEPVREPPRNFDEEGQARPRAERGRSRFAANDDRRSATPYQRRPSRLIYPTAAALSVAWAVLVLAYAMSTGGLFGEGDALASPRFLNIVLAVGVPIAFIWGIASMIWRTQEMRIVVREAGARVRLISDGDVSAALLAASTRSPVDLLWGVGGTPEG